jgi:putative ribosome biogenesis GTPase RsgA
MTKKAKDKEKNKEKNKAKSEKFARGDEVTWRSHGSTAEGTVVRKLTRRTEAAGRTVDASPNEPQYEVRSAKSDSTAVHKPSALRKK